MQVKPLQVKSDPDVLRHQSMRKLALNWLAQTRSSQQKLVELVNRYWHAQGEASFKCEHTLLSRMLHPTEPYVALAGRAKAVKIQEAILVICSGPVSPSVIETTSEPNEVWASDEEHAFVAHRARLRSLRERDGLRPFQALSLMGELVANGLGMDDTLPSNPQNETLRQRALENTLLTLAVIVDEPDVVHCLAQRAAQADGLAMERALALQESQIARVRKMMSGVKAPTVGMMAYAGVVLFHAGKRETGFGLLIQAVQASHDMNQRHDPNWETLLDLLDRLLAQQAPDADVCLEQAAGVFEQTLTDPARAPHRQLMTRAFAMVEAVQVKQAMKARYPKLYQQLYPSHEKTLPRAVSGAVMILLLALSAALMGAILLDDDGDDTDLAQEPARVMSVAASSSNGSQAAVRGREAKGGPSNPPPPPPTEQQT